MAGRLAVDGGVPVRQKPLPKWPAFEPEDGEAVAEVLRSGNVNYWTGQEGKQFEQEFADACGVKYAVAVANGTVALELAVHALGIRPGDEVIVPCRSFVASAACGAIRGARPVMADVERDSQTIAAESIRSKLTDKTRGIVAVHLAGWPCDMEAILAMAREHGLWVIEDCAQAQGARYQGRPVGSSGHVAAFSFCQDKIMTTGGEGGMLVTSDAAIWAKAWSYRDHGRDTEADAVPMASAGYRYVYNSLGTNWRMTEMQAALGRRLLKRVPEWVGRRRELAGRLHQGLAGCPGLRLAEPPEGVTHAYYRYYAFVRPERLREGWGRDRILQAIRAEGIPCFSGSCPELYREDALREYGPAEPLAVARELGETSVAFLVHPTLGVEDIADTVTAVRKVMDEASRID